MLVMHRGSYAFHPSLLTGMPSVLTLVHKTLGEKKTDKARLFHSFLFNFSLVGPDLVANLIYLQFTQCNANIDTHIHTHCHITVHYWDWQGPQSVCDATVHQIYITETWHGPSVSLQLSLGLNQLDLVSKSTVLFFIPFTPFSEILIFSF